MDGGADGNGRNGFWGAAGWGAHVMEVVTVAQGPSGEWCSRCDSPHHACVCELDAALAGDFSAGDAKVTMWADLWGSVVTNSRAACFFGAEKGTNNTGEVTGVIQILLWLLHCAGDGDAVILCDSCYAMDGIEERMQLSTNVKLIECARTLLAQVRATRTVTFTHVKGHSTDGGNSRAVELVQWGKGDGPYSQLRHDGEIEGEGALRAEPDYEERMARRKAAKRNRGGNSLANQNADEGSPTTAAARGRLEGTEVGVRDRSSTGGRGGDDTPRAAAAAALTEETEAPRWQQEGTPHLRPATRGDGGATSHHLLVAGAAGTSMLGDLDLVELPARDAPAKAARDAPPKARPAAALADPLELELELESDGGLS